MVSRFVLRCLFALLAGAVLVWAQDGPHAKQGSNAAAEVYMRQCSFCHGADGSGNTPVGKNFKLRALGSAEVQQMSDDQLFDIINQGTAQGTAKMPAFGKLGHDTIHGLVAYVRGFKKSK